ncbi:uncharacterized protein LOC134688415 [Mytilus trossulus]|uniref:uncharacterized protein LOC134688415 n=1 Tax=Mytilus trossulus TaxID=6551 RepID=UPI00300617E4
MFVNSLLSRMAITWTNDIIESTANKTTRNDELDSQAMHTEDILDSKTRSVEATSDRCNSINNASPHEITHSRIQELTKENIELKSKLNCFICRQNLFTHVLIPCGHLVCGNCVKLTCCCCSLRIERYHQCTLPSYPHTTGHTVTLSSSINTLGAFSR